MQSQITRPYGHDQADESIRIHHPEEEEHHEKRTSKVLKKVKEKTKKIKSTLTGHEHDHDVDEEDEYDEPDPEVHGAPVYESSAVRGGVTGQPESLRYAGETTVPTPEEIVPPGTKVFPVVSSDYTKPIEPEPLQDTLYGHEALSHPARTTDKSDKEERREEAPIYHPLRISELTEREESIEAHHEPMNTPVSLLSATEDVTRTFAPGGEDKHLGGQRKVNIERPKGLEEDPAAPGGGSDYLSGVSNYQSKVTDPTKQGGGEIGIPKIAESLGRMKVTDQSTEQETGPGLEKDLPTRSHESDQKSESKTGKDSPTIFGEKSGAALGEDFSTTELVRDLPTGTHDQFSPELSRPKERDDFEETKDKATQETKPRTYAEKLASATSPITNKAIAVKDAVASKLGYSGESGGGEQYESSARDETPRSATGYGQKVAGTVAEKLTPVYEKIKETGSNVMTKLPLSGGGSGMEETHHREGKGVSTRDYLSEKLRPGEEDKALSEVITEKLHLGGGEKKKTMTKEMEVTVEKIPTEKVLEEREHGEVVGEEGKGRGGMAGKFKGAVTSWLSGTKPKSPHSVEESSPSLGSTVGTTGFPDSGGSEVGMTGVGSGAVPVQKGLGN